MYQTFLTPSREFQRCSWSRLHPPRSVLHLHSFFKSFWQIYVGNIGVKLKLLPVPRIQSHLDGNIVLKMQIFDFDGSFLVVWSYSGPMFCQTCALHPRRELCSYLYFGQCSSESSITQLFRKKQLIMKACGIENNAFNVWRSHHETEMTKVTTIYHP